MIAYSPDSLVEKIREADEHEMTEIAKTIFTNRFYHSFHNELNFFIRKADFEALADLIQYAFSRSHSGEWGHSLNNLCCKIDKHPELNRLYTLMPAFIFSKEHSIEYPIDVFKHLININDPELDKLLIQKVFTKPHSVRWRKCFRVIIERANPERMDLLFKEVFNKDEHEIWKEENELAHEHLY